MVETPELGHTRATKRKLGNIRENNRGLYRLRSQDLAFNLIPYLILDLPNVQRILCGLGLHHILKIAVKVHGMGWDGVVL